MSITELRIATPRWGIPFSRPATASGGLPLCTMPLPDQLIVPLKQSSGTAARPVVRAGDRVLKGQPIGTSAATQGGAAVHAPTSGRVLGVEPRPIASGGTGPCVIIEADHEDTPWPGYTPTLDPLGKSPVELRDAVIEAGIVGLGGAIFPTGDKLDPDAAIRTLILNGVECEPRINCDDALMQHSPDRMLTGAQIMLRILGADECLVAVKADAGQALQQLRASLESLDDSRFKLALVPPVYPAGGEAQLAQLLAGREIPVGGLPRDIGIVCQNVATAAAVADFLCAGEPLISRIVTVAGTGIAQQMNVRTRIGTPLQSLLDFAGGFTPDAGQLIMGGPMMGISLTDTSIPVSKATNCIYVRKIQATEPAGQEMPCIRCGDCAVVCPADLTPQLLLQSARASDFSRLQDQGLEACIDCGCCDYVCPSHIPLTRLFVDAKRQLANIAFERKRADLAAVRFAARSERLQAEAESQKDELRASDPPPESAAADARDALRQLLDRVNRREDGADP